MDEPELLQAAKLGDRKAIETLLMAHQDRVYRFGMRLCADPNDAEDVAQDTLLAMAQSIPRFEGRSSLSTWLYSVVRSFCIKKRRKSKFAPSELEPIESLTEPAQGLTPKDQLQPDAALAAKQLEAAFERALHALDPDQREVLVLRDIEGLSAAEVAEVLEISVSAVKSRLHRARLNLRERMLPYMQSEAEALPSGAQCPDILTLYSKHLEGEIEATVCQRMEQHIAACPHCSATCDSLKRTLALCGAARSSEVPEDVQHSVREALREFLASSDESGTPVSS